MNEKDQIKAFAKIIKDQKYVIAFIDPIEPEKVFSFIGTELTDMETLYMIDSLDQLRQANFRPEQYTEH